MRDLDSYPNRLRELARELLADAACIERGFEAEHDISLLPVIFSVVCDKFAVDKRSIRNRSQHQRLVTPRHVAIYLSRKLTRLPQSTIGALYERDHSTISNSFDKIQMRVLDEPLFGKMISELETRILSTYALLINNNRRANGKTTTTV